jgi:hypothetical protein
MASLARALLCYSMDHPRRKDCTENVTGGGEKACREVMFRACRSSVLNAPSTHGTRVITEGASCRAMHRVGAAAGCSVVMAKMSQCAVHDFGGQDIYDETLPAGGKESSKFGTVSQRLCSQICCVIAFCEVAPGTAEVQVVALPVAHELLPRWYVTMIALCVASGMNSRGTSLHDMFCRQCQGDFKTRRARLSIKTFSSVVTPKWKQL